MIPVLLIVLTITIIILAMARYWVENFSSNKLFLTTFILVCSCLFIVCNDYDHFTKKEFKYIPVPVIEYYGNRCIIVSDKVEIPDFQIPEKTKIVYKRYKVNEWWRFPFCSDCQIVLNKGD